MGIRELLNNNSIELAGATSPLLAGLVGPTGLVIGELVALVEAGCVPLVVFGAPHRAAAVEARSLIDLDRRHIGAQVALMFERSDLSRPIVIGVLRGRQTPWPLDDLPGQIELESGGSRMIVSAREALVLRCGKSSVTLSADGRVEIQGVEIVSQAVRANRIRGGSVELN